MSPTLPLSLLATARNKEEKERLVNQFLAARPVLSVYLDLILKNLETLDYQETSPDNFAQPEVTHRLAYQAGQRKALDSMLTLLEWVNSK